MPLTENDVDKKRKKLAEAREAYQAKLPQLKKYMKAADDATKRRAFLAAYHIETKDKEPNDKEPKAQAFTTDELTAQKDEQLKGDTLREYIRSSNVKGLELNIKKAELELETTEYQLRQETKCENTNAKFPGKGKAERVRGNETKVCLI